MKVVESAKRVMAIAWTRAICALRGLAGKLSCERGQGTTEYAILVGVLVSEG